jgi:hypothetical protein
MQFPPEDKKLLKSLASLRDDRTRLKKLDDWWSDHPKVSWTIGTTIVLLGVLVALNLELQWGLESTLYEWFR